MRKIISYISAAVILVSAVLFSCTKTDSIGDTYSPGATVSASVTGRVTDINKRPVSNATVTIGTSTATTDINGKFKFSSVSMSKNTGFVKITKSGFFNGSRTFVVSTGATNYVEVQLIPKVVSGTFGASSGGDVNPSNGGKVSFTANSVINESTGAAYSGTVSVSAFFLNPSDANFSQYMPGDLRGINASNQERNLQSFGMMAVEMNGGSGEKLQLASGKTATVTFPIPAAMQATAPATIPLWHFDETKGMWVEEGSATKQGTNYVGTVSHFSFWNCDVPTQNVEFSGTFKDQNGNPLVYHRVALTSTVWGTTWGYTDSLGFVSGRVPANETLVMNVYSNVCYNSSLLTQNVGPFATSTNIGTVTVTTTAPTTATITGTVIDCGGAAVNNGYVQVQVDNNYINAPINAGAFSVTINRCSNTAVNATVTAIDLTGAQQGNPVTVSVTSGTANAGQLTACGISTNQFINLTLNNVNYVFLPPADSLSAYIGSQGANNGFTINGNKFTAPNAYQYVSFATAGNTTGTFPLTYFNFVNGGNSATVMYTMSGVINTTVTEFGSAGQYIAGSFSGMARDSAGTATVPVSCTYRVKRN